MKRQNKNKNRKSRNRSVAQIPRNMLAELKCFDAIHQQLGGWTETSSASTKIVFLQALAQGIQSNQRRGRKYRIIGSEFLGRFAPSHNEMYAQVMTLSLVQDKVTQGQSITWGDIWTLSGSPTPEPQFDALRSMDYIENARVVWQRTTRFADAGSDSNNPSTSVGSTINQKVVHVKLRLNIIVHLTTGNTSSVADIQDNSLYLTFLSNVGSGSGTYKPNGYWTHRLYFVDM